MSRRPRRTPDRCAAAAAPIRAVPGGLERSQKPASIAGKNRSVPDGLEGAGVRGRPSVHHADRSGTRDTESTERKVKAPGAGMSGFKATNRRKLDARSCAPPPLRSGHPSDPPNWSWIAPATRRTRLISLTLQSGRSATAC